ncbi:MAG: hypothetical protein DRP78_05940 [Candidatus Omnitrophota bacterium]|nr:MAG: hypothetical protein DRP78_05940 [Candidatus Omnitrophota bacterium]
MSTNSNNFSFQEQRKYVRLSRQDILQYKRFTAKDFNLDAPEDNIKSVTKNYSAGGALFETDTEFKIGDLLRIEITIPGWEKFKAEFYKEDDVTISKPLVVLTSVVRVKVICPGKFEIGVCFSAIDDGHKWAVMKYVNQKMNP